MVTLEAALSEDLPVCLRILDDARAFQREQGFIQWPDGYPSMADLEEDLAAGDARVLKVDGAVAGYLYLGFGDDPTYAVIDGAWASSEPYAVIHRVAISAAFRGQGLMKQAFTLAEAEAVAHGVHWLRMDTDFPNLRMQHVIERAGFSRRGVIESGNGPRIAYDKSIV